MLGCCVSLWQLSQFTVNVTVAVFDTEPDVAVTVMVDVPGGVPLGAFPPPPHPMIKAAETRNRVSSRQAV